jgi:hypothetical protein
VAKFMKYALIIILFVLASFGVAYASSQSLDLDPIEIPSNFSYINQQLLESSRYTQDDTIDPLRMLDYKTNYSLSYTEAELNQLGFDKMFETPELRVYFEKDSFSMIVENRITGYFWSSRPEFQGMSGAREDNVANRNLMNSGLWVSTVRTQNITSGSVQTQSLYTLAEVNYLNDASITPENPDHLRPYMIEPGSYATRRVETTITSQNASSFTVFVNIKTLSISFNIDISLVDGAIEVHIPTDSITENGDVFRLTAITVFPYFGASREDRMPGYLVIPDGLGALVRTNQRYNTYFQARFFGSDAGYQAMILPELSLPIFGNVHEPGSDGFYARILEGAEFSTLTAFFWGASTRYHRINSRFNVRQIYRNIINKAGDGNDQIPQGFNPSDYRVAYQILSDQDASYVGIAKNYRDYLLSEGILNSEEKVVNNQVPIHLSYIMSDQEPSFIGTTRVVMTTANDVKEAYQTFKSEGLLNQQIALMGWSRDGFINRTPYRTNTWDRGLSGLIDTVVEDDNTIYLENDYTMASENSRRVNYNRDVARNLSRLKMSFRMRSLNTQVTEVYYLYPDSSFRFAQNDQSFFDDLGISGLFLNNLGSTLFSYYDNQFFYRNQTIDYYQQIAALNDHLLLSKPNVYMYPYMTGYMDLPITNSQYDYYTDLVPLVPIILKGNISFYTPYLNFNALSDDRLLAMVDFGANPSYVLTEEITFKMRYTHASFFYTTYLKNYQEEIVTTYQFVNNALRHVVHASIEDRQVLSTGLVRVDYDNGVSIYVNYNYTSRNVGALQIQPRSYEVVLP